MKIIGRFRGEHSFLSNFHPCAIRWQGVTYPSVEHAYVAAKSMDQDIRLKIAALPSPAAAKRAGRSTMIEDFDPVRWPERRLAIMAELLRLKFAIPELRALLIATEGQALIEGNWWGDEFWGVCRDRGANHLGALLMTIREESL